MASNPNAFVICAHRGASGYAPENTLASMRKAIELGAQMSELDVQQTADDQLVVFHDERLGRTTTGTGYLWQKTLAELRELDAGSWYDEKYAGEKIPTLDELVALVRGQMKLNIEVKLHGHERKVAALVVQKIRELHFEKDCIITSFGHAVADSIKALAPDFQVGYIFDISQYSDAVFRSPVDILSAHYKIVDAEFMRKARAAGKKVHVWTVNDKGTMQKMLDLGVDAVITNYPDRLAEVAAIRKPAG